MILQSLASDGLSCTILLNKVNLSRPVQKFCKIDFDNQPHRKTVTIFNKNNNLIRFKKMCITNHLTNLLGHWPDHLIFISWSSVFFFKPILQNKVTWTLPRQRYSGKILAWLREKKNRQKRLEKITLNKQESPIVWKILHDFNKEAFYSHSFASH